ncbi:bifunctional diguanylate cyclase/phosphodiesterase [Neptuniibacter sp. CAU 1671]|uniref:putative bifunctional diguanylate cyclase/phosphodiesterase n=1 Tax=Neptuniibacter sp. CAU 1671 TaxID=3032593 RepID=UPI0023D9F4CC|nr:bifunctional diguanylate cyclase/phosphodiesterase [Neptuniibacter sp. CAU 1671]MDF2182198.1 bifunctional diguanylate cyclase/phosphodiesterase [Neptuniibacter sp. CAU 1671]
MQAQAGTIKAFLLRWILLFSALGFVVIFLIASQAYTSSIRKNASEAAERMARQTFNSMYLVMSQGWNRQQLQSFLDQMEQNNADSDIRINLYRGERVNQRFGFIGPQSADSEIRRAFSSGQSSSRITEGSSRFLYPLQAQATCLQCHTNADEGEVLGVIEVQQNLDASVGHAQINLGYYLSLIAPLPLLFGFLAVTILTRRIDRSIHQLTESIAHVESISDLELLQQERQKLGFAELTLIHRQVGSLASKLRDIAVDKELLEFEIRLLEKFVITSEVVRDWREYVSELLMDINQVIVAHTMFSIFKVDDELFDLEIFWLSPPTDRTQNSMEKAVLNRLQEQDNVLYGNGIQIRHNVANRSGGLIDLDQNRIELQCKSLLVETPKIGGIVGIGVQSDIIQDQTKVLVLESILSTLLNVVGSVRAIYKYTRDLEYYATRDPLTHLYNQRMFWELLEYELDRGMRHDYPVAILLIDLDNFKAINDGYGHSWGDRLLENFARTLETSFTQGDVVARYGGDEFVVMLPDCDQEKAEATALRLLSAIRAFSLPYTHGSPLKITASIGIGIFPDHAQNKKDLFMFVDNMMYRAKRQGRDRLCAPDEHDLLDIFKDMHEKTRLVQHAIEQHKLVPVFQPIQSTSTGEIKAVEVLSRIELPDNELMHASEFIEIAESMDLIHTLDEIVMEKTFQIVQKVGYQGLLFINMSPKAVVVKDFIPCIKSLTERYGIEAQQIVFEITERDTVKSITVLEQFVAKLRGEGFKLAIDDFGSGFSSFHYLKHLPIDYVKIEGEFIANMVHDSKDMALVNSIAKLSQELGLETIAEFVESAEVLAMVRAANISYAQGYHIGRPTPDLAGILGKAPLALSEQRPDLSH